MDKNTRQLGGCFDFLEQINVPFNMA